MRLGSSGLWMKKRAVLMATAGLAGCVLPWLGGCGSGEKEATTSLLAQDFKGPVNAKPTPTAEARKAPDPTATPVASTTKVVPVATTSAPPSVTPLARPVPPRGSSFGTLVDAKIGDVNNRAVYASQFLGPMEATLKAKAVELLKAAPDKPEAARAAWTRFAEDQVGAALVRFIRDEVFRAEGMASLKPEERVGFRAFLDKVRQDEIRRDFGSQTLAEERVARDTGGQSLDDYMKQREQREIINYQLSQQIDRKVQVPWRDIRQQYERDFKKFNPDPTAVLRVIIVPRSDTAGAETVAAALTNGESFAKVASGEPNTYKVKEGGLHTAQFAGDLTQAELFGVKPLSEAARLLRVGSWSGPVEFEGGKGWVYLEGIEQSSRTLYDAQLGIENELFDGRRAKMIEQYMSKLRGRASLTDINDMMSRLMAYAGEQCFEPVVRGDR